MSKPSPLNPRNVQTLAPQSTPLLPNPHSIETLTWYLSILTTSKPLPLWWYRRFLCLGYSAIVAPVEIRYQQETPRPSKTA